MFLALRDLRRSWRRFLLVGLVVALVGVLSTVLAGLSDGLVTDGISGLRGLPLTHLALQPGSEKVFSRSIVREDSVAPWRKVPGAQASELGVSFVNATADSGGPSIDLALFGVPKGSFLVTRPEAREALAGQPGLVLASALRDQGVEVGDRYTLGASGVTLPVLGFTFAGSYGHVPIAFTSLDTWQAVAYGDGVHDRFSAVALDLPAGTSAAVADAARDSGTEVVTKAQAYAGSPGYSAETGTMTLIRGFLLVISALIVGAFFTVLTVQRTRQIGMLKALGASSAYVLRDGLGQIALVVLAATAAGTAAGTAITALLAGGAVPIELSARTVTISALALAVAGILGSLVAFRRITGVEPAVALGVEA